MPHNASKFVRAFEYKARMLFLLNQRFDFGFEQRNLVESGGHAGLPFGWPAVRAIKRCGRYVRGEKRNRPEAERSRCPDRFSEIRKIRALNRATCSHRKFRPQRADSSSQQIERSCNPANGIMNPRWTIQ